MSDAKKAWGGRFEGSPSRFLDEYGASLPVDRRMWEEDIHGSIAHAKMLAAQGIIEQADADAIEAGLSEIYREIRDGKFTFDIADEDIHMAIERVLTERIGPAGARLHTGRSRNDQVALDTRMYAKRQSLALIESALRFQKTLLDIAQSNADQIMPGYTHMQKAQPVLFSQHMMAYFWMISRDVRRLQHAYEAADEMPLGSAALAGTTFDIDREAVCEALGFSAVMPNSMDAVSDRDFLIDLACACSVVMVHLSRLCEELITWSTEEFGFVTMDDTYSTGSSIMPQKKNPDFAELTRGKTGRVVGDLVALLTMLKGLPLAYNKDMQEDKEGVFDAIDTTLDALAVMDGMVSAMHLNEEAMTRASHGGFMAATDLADHLVGTGMPFRKAHEVVGRLVLSLEKEGRTLQQMTPAEFGEVDPSLAAAGAHAVDIEAVVARRSSQGGTAPEAVEVQIQAARESHERARAWLSERQAK